MKLVLLGIIQGLTEFLPVSSSGHLYFLRRLLPIEGNYLSFVVILHLATLLAIIIFFFPKLNLFFNWRLLANIILITVISGSMGLGIKILLEKFFGNRYLLTFCFLVNSGILLSIKGNSRQRDLPNLGWKDSLLIGILQGFSPFPGISRSGITLAGLLRRGFKKEDAFTLSFLMAIPLIIGAFLVELTGTTASGLSLPGIGVSFVAAFLFGLLALKIVKKTLIINRFKSFGYYCLIIALLSLIV